MFLCSNYVDDTLCNDWEMNSTSALSPLRGRAPTFENDGITWEQHQQLPGPRLNIKTVLSSYGDSHVKDEMVGETVFSLTWERLYW